MISSDIISSGGIDNILKDLYIDESQLEYQRKRYINALNRFTQLYGEGDVFIFSAPGRSEIGGNHTDHQNGKVLAASINLDIIAVVRPGIPRRVCQRKAVYLGIVVLMPEL